MPRTRLLGAILAGGQSKRFGSDKCAALFDGRALIDHVAASLKAQTEQVVVIGRDWPSMARIEDRPAPGLGPLGGLCGALHWAADQRFDEVLTVGCDSWPLADGLADALGAGPAVADRHWLIGRWPVALVPTLDAWLATTSDRSMRGWIAEVKARIVPLEDAIGNINRPEDLARLGR